VDAAEIITRFFTITALSDILRQKGEFPEPVQDALTEKLERPTFGAWKDLLSIAIDNLPKERGQTRCFVSELPSFVRDKWLPALGSGEDKPEEKLIALRNLIAHAGRLSDEKAQELLNAHRQRFESLAKELSFFANYDLIACTKEGQIVWLKGLPDADGAFPEYDRSLSFVPEHGRVYLVHDGEGLDLFPLHAFTDILQWREERYDFESLGEVAPQIYFRLSERGYLECIPFSNKAVFSYLGEDAHRCFREIFQLEEWRKQRRLEDEAQGIQTLWDELVRELTEVFVGREEHIKQVKDAIKRTNKGVLWISGKPGVGKSALMAKLMRDYIGQTQHYIVIPYFFRYGQAGCSTMDFLATALKRLKAELNREIEPEPRLPDRQKQLVEALEEAVSETGKKVLFLVDGLDEIYRQEREFLNVPFMTMTVKDRIVWVCAGRSEGDLGEILISRGAEYVFPEGLPPLDEQATRAMLVEHLGRLKYDLFKRDDGERNRFIEAVADKSKGLPLYVRMVIEDLKAGQLTVWDEKKLPEGLKKYYEWLLERLRVHDIGTVLTPLVCLLAWAKEPITEGTMKVLLQTHYLAGTPKWGESFRKALKYGHLMLQQRPTPEGEAGWTIYHDSFRQHLLESETVSDNREWAQERWLKVCEDWKALASQEPSLHRYILRHYVAHLLDSGNLQKAVEILTNAEFIEFRAYADLLQHHIQECETLAEKISDISQREMLYTIASAIAIEMPTLRRFPELTFQTLVNSCRWVDATWTQSLIQGWISAWKSSGRGVWLERLLPPREIPRASPIVKVLTDRFTCKALAFSNDGKYLAGAGGQSVIVWEVESGERVCVLEVPQFINGGFIDVAWSEDGRWIGAIGHLEGYLALWDFKDKSLKFFEKIHEHGCTVAFCPRELRDPFYSWDLLTCGRDSFRLWFIQNDQEKVIEEALSGEKLRIIQTRLGDAISWKPPLAGAAWARFKGQQVIVVATEAGQMVLLKNGVTPIAGSNPGLPIHHVSATEDGRFIAIVQDADEPPIPGVRRIGNDHCFILIDNEREQDITGYRLKGHIAKVSLLASENKILTCEEDTGMVMKGTFRNSRSCR
jgi:DNA polymerase III delta prime subunit